MLATYDVGDLEKIKKYSVACQYSYLPRKNKNEFRNKDLI